MAVSLILDLTGENFKLIESRIEFSISGSMFPVVNIVSRDGKSNSSSLCTGY